MYLTKSPINRIVSLGSSHDYWLCVPKCRGDGEAVQIALTDIFDAVSDGTVASKFPQLTPKDITLCEAFLQTNHSGHESYHRNNRGRRISILFDEQLPYGFVPALTQELPNLSHVYLEGLAGYTDEFIFNRPRYALKGRTIKEHTAHRTTKYVIISRDQDLTDLAQEQWKSRIRACSTPEDINFDDVNVVFHVKGQLLGSVRAAPIFAQYAKDIMRFAYSNTAASYVVGSSGVHVESGSSLKNLIAEVEMEQRIAAFRMGKIQGISPEEVADGRRTRKLARSQEKAAGMDYLLQNG